ncbi:E3 ubiquitin-protein ligase PRT1 [Magnolia sinica]|uniref:E3 ubiquitin-protein ligase PRT1 n=1 Tax=Magnolia sinica TaxID=86752 RepID=UPI00265A6534|nr:E3 ubiquitin-protein ligase PRT1 [Magnolia sinica]
MDEKKAAPDSWIASKEDQTLDPCVIDDDDDNIPECFRCCVCLDLLYKPIVLACGHISCFWCVHKAMNSFRQSHCPICRHPYNHFPGICELLHFLLMKVEPVAYKRMEMQVLEEEKKADCFSPQIDDQLATKMVHSSKEPDLLVCSPYSSTECHYRVDPYSDACSPEKSNLGDVANPLDCDTSSPDNVKIVPAKSCPGGSGTNRNLALEENNFLENGTASGICKQVSVTDVLCTACKQLLFRPAVLNCGHVYCESCIATPVDESIQCQICQSLHPGGLPKVCLVFDQFLEENFSKEYALRKEALHLKKTCCQQEGPSTCAVQTEKQAIKSWLSPIKNDFSWWTEHASKVHVGVGCDSCGMCPIIGERYRCIDCVEVIGFDLCGDCYKTPSKLPGRFNQKHTPDHRFELVQSNMLRNLVMRLVVEQSEDGSDATILSDDVLDPQNTDSAT